MENYFTTLYKVNVNEHVEEKNGLSYLSWAWAWAEVKKLCPDANYKIYENKDEWNYFTDGKTCWVKVGVIISGIEHVETLAVMDNRNKSISADAVTSMDVNKSIQRCLTKACARHGLGLYIYAGEDIPETNADLRKNEIKTICKANNIPNGVVKGIATELGIKDLDSISDEEYEQYKKELSAWKSSTES